MGGVETRHRAQRALERRPCGGAGPAKKAMGFAAVTIAVVASSCAPEDAPSTLDPRGPGAARIAGTWWLMLGISTVVFLIVLGFMAVALVRSRRAGPVPQGDVRWGEPVVIVGGVVIPAIILTAMFVVSLRDMAALSAPMGDTTMTIAVEGHDWWWEATYSDPAATTANEIHIPVGQPVELELTTDDVLHSFWVPQLQAKTDMISGKVNRMWIEADEPGRFRGQCAEYCGLQHAKMIFYVVAQREDDFEAWLANEAKEAADPADPGAVAGEEVFMNETCAGCHAIRGTDADAQLGPDLTHLAARATIAAGVLDNTRADLAEWIVDPQGVKDGASMPPSELSAQELDDLLDYLESLE